MKDLQLKNCRLDGRYDVKERLGRGSYAEIFIADDALASPTSAHKTVVIKALNVFLQNDLDHDLERTLVENFQNEALSLDRVRHPNIISRLGHGTAKDLRGTVFHYLILEFLPGGDLARYVRENAVGVTRALNFLEQVAAGLAFAHKHGIIHRDIKPHNLLLTRNLDIVKIADFGVARSTVSEDPITRVGTNVYAPPEHSPLLSGKTGSLDFNKLTPAADIYSLAKTAYVLFTRESPRYSSNKPIEQLPHAFRVEPWSGPLLQILKKATQDNPRDRHQDVVEFWRELSALSKFAEPAAIPGGLQGIASPSSANVAPQAHIARGFSPNAPIRPVFDTSKNLRLKEVAPTQRLRKLDFRKPAIRPGPAAFPPVPLDHAELEGSANRINTENSTNTGRRKTRRWVRGLLTFGVLLAVFAGSLYATYNYLLGRPLFSGFIAVRERTAIATTDVNLRPAPTTSNEPLGVVTRDSKVRIVRTSNKWHEVVIIQQGRERSDAGSARQGWVYGDYIAEEK